MSGNANLLNTMISYDRDIKICTALCYRFSAIDTTHLVKVEWLEESWENSQL